MTLPSDIRDPKEYKDVLFDLTLAYIKSPEFSTLSDEERIRTADIISEMDIILCSNDTQEKEEDR